MNQKDGDADLRNIAAFVAKHKLMPYVYFACAIIIVVNFFNMAINGDFFYAIKTATFITIIIVSLGFVWEFYIKDYVDHASKTEKLKYSKVDFYITRKHGKKISLNWSIGGDVVVDNSLLPGVSLLGYRLPDRLPHNPLEAKKFGKLIINTRNLSGEVTDEDIRPGQTGYYALFLQGDGLPPVAKNAKKEDNDEIPFSAMATVIERAPEGEMAKLARKLRYHELEERLKSKSGQGGSIAEMARKEMEDAVTTIENFGEFFKNIKETKEKSKEKIRKSNMGDEDKEELLEAVDALADEVIDKKIGMGSMT